MELVRRQYKLKLPLRLGEALATEMKISSLPATVFVADTHRDTYMLKGSADSEEMEKVVRLMKGGR